MLRQADIDKFYDDLESLGLKRPVSEVSKATGFGKGQVSIYLNKKDEPSENFIKAFYKSFEKSLKTVERETVVEEPQAYLERRRNLKNSNQPDVPIFGGFTTLGNIVVYDDDNMKNKVIGKLPSDMFSGCDYGERAKGDSMYPLIMNQALLVGKTCSVKGITYGEKYIIKTKDGNDTTKFVHPGSTPETIKLKAYNKSVPEQEFHIDDIVFVCRVYWIINPT